MTWYALRSRPHMEQSAYRQVRARGFGAYLPCLPVKPTNPRARKLRPLFPGYLFVEADLQAVGLSAFQYVPYSSGLVCFGGEPAPITNEIIQGLRRRLLELAPESAAHGAQLARGDRVVIVEGPLAEWEAVVDRRISGKARVRVLLELLGGRRVPLELPVSQVNPLSRT